MSSTILRQWLVLGMLPRPPRRIDTGSIEARLRDRGIEVHRRTIQRDLLELAEVFPIVADERAKPYGWRWADDADGMLSRIAPRARSGPRVALSLRVAEAHLEQVLEVLGSPGEYELVARGEPALTIAVTVEDSRAARHAVFGVSDVAEVLAPREWRREIAERAQRVLDRQTSE
jgi:predicted DNA-binding transcriptional regulator YafY